jgi:hypothetical protein
MEQSMDIDGKQVRKKTINLSELNFVFRQELSFDTSDPVVNSTSGGGPQVTNKKTNLIQGNCPFL